MNWREPFFFVGYLPVPEPLRSFLLGVVAFLLTLSLVLGIWIGATQDDPGPGAFRFDYGRQTVTGVIELTPIPVLHVTEGNELIPDGHTLLMSAGGKNGVMNRPAAVNGQIATASGVLLERGSIIMMQVRGGNNGLRPGDAMGHIPKPEDLGRWRLAGEICDGKCLAGAMRPGRGIAHKACANLCLIGGVPPVFVSSQPVLGEEYLLISGPDRQSIPDAILSHVAQYISVEGRISRHGDLLVFAMEPETIEVLP